MIMIKCLIARRSHRKGHACDRSLSVTAELVFIPRSRPLFRNQKFVQDGVTDSRKNCYDNIVGQWLLHATRTLDSVNGIYYFVVVCGDRILRPAAPNSDNGDVLVVMEAWSKQPYSRIQ
jgi:hypothetical protein